MSRRDEYWDSQYVWTVDCRNGKTTKRYAPIELPDERPDDLPTRAELEAEKDR